MAELSGNNSNQRGQDEHYKKTKKVTVYFYDTSNDVPVRVSSSNPLPTTATISGDVTVTGSAAYSDSGGVDKKGLVDADRHIQVDVLTSALPSGASTSATDTNTAAVSTNLGAKADASATTDTGSFSLISLFKRLLEKMTTLVAKDFSTETTLSALNTKVPASPATSGKQDTGNTSLSSIDGKITAVNTGAVVVSSSALPTGAATAANQQTNALTDTQLRATAVPVSGTVTANLSATDNAVLDDIALDTEAIKTSLAGTLTVTGGGGGVEYTEGDTDATIVGGAIMVEDAANTLQPLQGDKTNGLDVDVTRSALPTGASTSANQTTIIGHVDGLETAVASTNTKLDTVNTNLGTIDGRVDGVETLIGTTNTNTGNTDTNTTDLPNVIGTDGSAGPSKAVSVGGTRTTGELEELRVDADGHLQIDVLSMPAGGSGLTDTELRATPVPVSGTVTANAGTNLNTSALATEAGNLATIKTNTDKIPAQGQALAAASTPVVLPATQITTLTPPAAITGFATSAKQDTAQTSLDAIKTSVELSDDAVYASDAAISKVVGVGAQFDDTTPGTTTENSVRSLRMSTRRELYNQIRDAAGNERGANVTAGNALVVDGSATTQPVSGTFWQATQPVSGTVTETNSAAIKTAVETLDNAIAGSEMQVDVVGALPAGTNAIGKLAANSGVDIGDVDVTSAVSATLDHGSNLDIDTAAEQITATSFACKFGVTLRADIANTGTLYIGNSDVTVSGTAATDGIPLYPGDSLFLPVTNSNIPYAIASANNQKVFWVAV